MNKQKFFFLIKILLSYTYFGLWGRRKGIISHPNYRNLFFGYYDISPFNFSEDSIVVHGQKEQSSESVDILIYSLKNKCFKILGSTYAWTYQQGSRLMWFDNNIIIFNSYEKDETRYFSILLNVVTGEEERIPYPIQVLYKNKYFLSINYYHLFQTGTEYGYKYEDNNNKDTLIRYDLSTREAKTILFLRDCERKLTKNYCSPERHHFNHFLISPSGESFIFIFRFYSNGRRVDNLMYYSFTKRQLQILIEDEVISHCTWRNEKEFLVWAKINSKEGYFLYNIIDNNFKLLYETGYDGHPTFISESKIITDTYPDRIFRQSLYVLDLDSMEKKILHEQKHPSIYSPDSRCDLHPSLSPLKKLYQIDIIDDSRRKIIVSNL